MLPRFEFDSRALTQPLLATPKGRTTRKKKEPERALQPSLELQGVEDRYSRSSAKQQKEQLEEELSMRLAAEKVLHQQKMRALLQQMEMQLFSIWQDVWLQRQKSWNDYQKSWAKVMLS